MWHETLGLELQSEINELEQLGYIVSIGYTDDRAYKQPNNINTLQ